MIGPKTSIPGAGGIGVAIATVVLAEADVDVSCPILVGLGILSGLLILAAVVGLVREYRARKREPLEQLAQECERLGARIGSSYRAFGLRSPDMLRDLPEILNATDEDQRRFARERERVWQEFLASYMETYRADAVRLYGEVYERGLAEPDPTETMFGESVAEAIDQPRHANDVGMLGAAFRAYAERLRKAP